MLSIDETDEPIGQIEVEAVPSDDASIAESLGNNPTPAERRRMSNATASRIHPSRSMFSHKILSNVRNSRFNEMEYSVAAVRGRMFAGNFENYIYDEKIDVQFVLNTATWAPIKTG